MNAEITRAANLINTLMNKEIESITQGKLTYLNVTNLPTEVAGAPEVFAALQAVHNNLHILADNAPHGPGAQEKALEALKDALPVLKNADPVFDQLIAAQTTMYNAALEETKKDAGPLAGRPVEGVPPTGIDTLLENIEHDAHKAAHHLHIMQAHEEAKTPCAELVQLITQIVRSTGAEISRGGESTPPHALPKGTWTEKMGG